MALGLGLLAGAVVVGVRYGVQQADVSNTARGAVLAAGGVIAGAAAAHFGHPEVGTGLAAAGVAVGGAMVLDDRVAPAAATAKSKLTFAKAKQMKGLEGYDLTDDEAEAFGALTATLGDADDEGDDGDDMGAVEAELGAVEAELGDADDEGDDGDDMGDADDELMYS